MSQDTLRRTVLKIGGMHCAGCIVSIQNSVLRLGGVEKCEVNLASEKAYVEYDSVQADIKSIEDQIRKAGYTVVYQDATFVLSGIDDLVDLHGLEKEIGKTDGVRQVLVNYGNSHMSLQYNPALVSLADLRQKISDLHYKIVSEDLTASAEQVESCTLKRYFLVSLALTVPVLIYSYPEIFGFVPFSGNYLATYFVFACSTVVQFGPGGRFYLGAYRVAKMRSANMDTLVVTGTTAAYLFSAAHIFPTPDWHHLSFDASSAVITFILLGKYLENKTKARTSLTMQKLLEIQPQMATIRNGNREVEVPVDNICQGDMIVVRPGLRIPVDGIVIDGDSAVDQSAITGESTPARKKAGDIAIGGTVNIEGALVIRALRVGRQTLLSQICKMVEDAVSKKPPMQKIVDAVAGRFAFVVMAVSAVTFLLWLVASSQNVGLALIPAVAILVVACPCALGLATPTAIMVGIGRGAQHGVLFKKSQALESLDKIDVAVFDKTGTLTLSRPQVTGILSLDNTKESEIIAVAASAERYSEHPIAKAITKKSSEIGVVLHDASNFISSPGLGVAAKVADRDVLVGSMRLMEQNKVNVSNALDMISNMQEELKIVVAVSVNLQLVGLISLQEVPRPESGATIQALKEQGIKTVMLTGDNKISANSVASKLGVDIVIADVLPQDKAREIERLQKGGNRVAMIGDGINDAPALSQADVGIVLGSGTDIALEAGDVILVQDNLLGIVSALDLARKTMQKIRRNITYAFAYNIVLIPLAGLGMLYPALAGAAMAASSVSVTTNSLLLKRWKPKMQATNLHS